MPKRTTRTSAASHRARDEATRTDRYFANLAVKLISDDRYLRDCAWRELQALRAPSVQPLPEPWAPTPDYMPPAWMMGSPVRTATVIKPDQQCADDAWRGTCELVIPDITEDLRTMDDFLLFPMDDLPELAL